MVKDRMMIFERERGKEKKIVYFGFLDMSSWNVFLAFLTLFLELLDCYFVYIDTIKGQLCQWLRWYDLRTRLSECGLMPSFGCALGPYFRWSANSLMPDINRK